MPCLRMLLKNPQGWGTKCRWRGFVSMLSQVVASGKSYLHKYEQTLRRLLANSLSTPENDLEMPDLYSILTSSHFEKRLLPPILL